MLLVLHQEKKERMKRKKCICISGCIHTLTPSMSRSNDVLTEHTNTTGRSNHSPCLYGLFSQAWLTLPTAFWDRTVRTVWVRTRTSSYRRTSRTSRTRRLRFYTQIQLHSDSTMPRGDFGSKHAELAAKFDGESHGGGGGIKARVRLYLCNGIRNEADGWMNKRKYQNFAK